ncbi:MAG: hypothetical protein WBO57_00505 [Gammaproteobacteria bacterium]
MMTIESRLAVSLFFLRISIFLVMLVWTLDKFINPQHAAAVYEKFYLIGGLGSQIMTVIGVIELIILVAFVAGYMKFYTYGSVLLLHAVSTFSSYKQYLAPYDGPNILFFAAWPMLAGCLALFLLRAYDTRLVAEK